MKKNMVLTVLMIMTAAFCFGCAGMTGSDDDTKRHTGPASVPGQTEAEETEPAEMTETSSSPTPEPTATPEPTPDVDTTAPFFINIIRDAYLTAGDEFNIDKFISYIDDRDSEIDLVVSGSVDPSVTGSYPLSLTITDDAGNQTSDQITVHVVAPQEGGDPGDYTATSTSNATPFSDFCGTYEGDSIHYGIDVSKWQGSIDWEQVASAGCEFAFIRAGWSSQGQFHEDEFFVANVTGAKAAGIAVGVYVYTTDNTVEDVQALADTMCDLVDGYDIELPIVFDWENFFDGFQKYRLSISDVNDLYRAFRERVRERGYNSMLYASKFILDVIWEDEFVEVWLAHYTANTDYQGIYRVWQQSCTGSVPGIDAYVDMDLYYGTLPGGN